MNHSLVPIPTPASPRRLHPGVLLLLVLLVGFALACRTTITTSNPPTPVIVVATVPVIPVPSLPVTVGNEEQLLEVLYSRVNPSVVNITVYVEQSGQVVPSAQGSGFVYDAEGHVVTNAHVVNGASQIDITFSGGLIRPATVVGEDLHSDLAALKVEDMPAGVSALPLGDMSTLQVGQTVVAIGNPFGLEGTLTRGIISALGRTIPALTTFSIPQSIQTDAAINPGNSGGPLLNLQGEVIGVNAQIETSNGTAANSGVGFAIPVSILKRVVPSLISSGKYDWAWLGVRGQSLDLSLVKAMDLPVERGAYLWQITNGGPASKAGLLGADNTVTVDGRSVDVGGDVVTAINGQPIYSFDDLLIFVALNTSPGQEVTLTILRNGASQDVKVKLEPRPSSVQ